MAAMMIMMVFVRHSLYNEIMFQHAPHNPPQTYLTYPDMYIMIWYSKCRFLIHNFQSKHSHKRFIPANKKTQKVPNFSFPFGIPLFITPQF